MARKISETSLEIPLQYKWMRLVNIIQVKDELTKNRRENNEAEEGGYMFEKIGDPLCPVASFEKYVSKFFK